MGEIDYWFRRQPRNHFGGPFNGQNGRLRVVEGIVKTIDPALILETGTFRGTTTEWFASLRRPVITIEGDPRNFAFAKLRLRRSSNVKLVLGDSRVALKQLATEELAFRNSSSILVYLDAHWNADLPLEGEVDIVFSTNPRAVVIIDDFEVADDPGYTFDDYGPGARLDMGYLSKMIDKHDLAAFHPRIASGEETGFRRGCAIVCRRSEWADKLLANVDVRPAPT